MGVAQWGCLCCRPPLTPRGGRAARCARARGCEGACGHVSGSVHARARSAVVGPRVPAGGVRVGGACKRKGIRAQAFYRSGRSLDV